MVINSYSGLFPWRKQSTRKDEASGFRFNVANQRTGKKKGSSGPYVGSGWTNKKPGMDAEFVELDIYNKRKTKVPIGDVEEFATFNKLTEDRVTPEMVAAVDKAFEKDSGRGRYYVCPGVGHITQIRYNPSMQIMEVGFRNRGDTVTFFRIPVSLYGEFEHLSDGAQGIGVDGNLHGLQGIRFWDLVRIRGQRTGARFPFVYTNEGLTAGASSGGDYVNARFEQRVKEVGEGPEQLLDANREATVTLTEEPSAAERQVRKQEKKISVDDKKAWPDIFTDANKVKLTQMWNIMQDKYSDEPVKLAILEGKFKQALKIGWWAIHVLDTSELHTGVK